MNAPVGKVWYAARKHQLPGELILLAAIVAQAVADAQRGNRAAAQWLTDNGF